MLRAPCPHLAGDSPPTASTEGTRPGTRPPGPAKDGRRPLSASRLDDPRREQNGQQMTPPATAGDCCQHHQVVSLHARERLAPASELQQRFILRGWTAHRLTKPFTTELIAIVQLP